MITLLLSRYPDYEGEKANYLQLLSKQLEIASQVDFPFPRFVTFQYLISSYKSTSVGIEQ